MSRPKPLTTAEAAAALRAEWYNLAAVAWIVVVAVYFDRWAWLGRLLGMGENPGAAHLEEIRARLARREGP